jgi:hypothetical protein
MFSVSARSGFCVNFWWGYYRSEIARHGIEAGRFKHVKLAVAFNQLIGRPFSPTLLPITSVNLS